MFCDALRIVSRPTVLVATHDAAIRKRKKMKFWGPSDSVNYVTYSENNTLGIMLVVNCVFYWISTFSVKTSSSAPYTNYKSILQYFTSNLSCYDTKCKICKISEAFCLYQCMKIADVVSRPLLTHTVLYSDVRLNTRGQA